MTAAFSIRDATREDIPDLLVLVADLDRLQAGWRVFEPRGDHEGRMEQTFRAALRDPDARLVLAEQAGEPHDLIGMAAGRIVVPSSFSDERALEVTSVIVVPEHRRRGIARALTASLAAFAGDRGVRRLTLKTFWQNQEALEAWLRMGFEPRFVQMTAPVEALEPFPGHLAPDA